MQSAQLMAFPLLAIAAFAAGNMSSFPDNVEQSVSLDGDLILNLPTDRGEFYEVPSGFRFVLTDIELLPIQGATKYVALVEQPFKGQARTRMAGEFVEQARLFTERRPVTQLVFEPGSKLIFAGHRQFTGGSCFAYHVRGRLVPQ